MFPAPDLQKRLISALMGRAGQPATRRDLARQFGVSEHHIAAVLDALAAQGAVQRELVKTPRGQNAFGYSVCGVRRFVDRAGHLFYTAPCSCGARRRLKANGPYYVLWHAGCGLMHVDVERMGHVEKEGTSQNHS